MQDGWAKMRRNEFLGLSALFLLISLVPSPALSQEADPVEGVVLGEASQEQPAEPVDDTDPTEESTDLTEPEATSPAPRVIEPAPPTPSLTTRVFNRHVSVDRRAVHSCKAETFKLDMSNQSSVQARLALRRGSEAEYQVEIGSLPKGINILFENNSDYLYRPEANDGVLKLKITNEQGSQTGNFSVPIIYTKTGTTDSAVICQLNIINQ